MVLDLFEFGENILVHQNRTLHIFSLNVVTMGKQNGRQSSENKQIQQFVSTNKYITKYNGQNVFQAIFHQNITILACKNCACPILMDRILGVFWLSWDGITGKTENSVDSYTVLLLVIHSTRRDVT